MQSRALRISMLAFVALWFGVVLPGHQRGAIQLPGYDAGGKTGAAACHTQKHCAACPTASANPRPAQQPEPESNPDHCAICFFIGVLDVPVCVTFDLPDYELLSVLSPPACRSIAAVASLDTLRERGPPVA